MKYFSLRQVNKPFFVIELPNDDYAFQLASRSISIRSVIEHWSNGSTYDSFHSQLKKYVAANAGNLEFENVLEQSFRVTVETYSKHIQQKQKIEKIESMDYLPFQGEVNLKTPDVHFYYIEDYGLDPNSAGEVPENIFFGRWVKINIIVQLAFHQFHQSKCFQLVDGNRGLIHEISLRTRKFIGNTSMDPTLSMLMANQAMVRPGDLVLDPFVGTGSLLVAAAKYGGKSIANTNETSKYLQVTSHLNYFIILHSVCNGNRYRLSDAAWKN